VRARERVVTSVAMRCGPSIEESKAKRNFLKGLILAQNER
jgi:hypothetical protein